MEKYEQIKEFWINKINDLLNEVGLTSADLTEINWETELNQQENLSDFFATLQIILNDIRHKKDEPGFQFPPLFKSSQEATEIKDLLVHEIKELEKFIEDTGGKLDINIETELDAKLKGGKLSQMPVPDLKYLNTFSPG